MRVCKAAGETGFRCPSDFKDAAKGTPQRPCPVANFNVCFCAKTVISARPETPLEAQGALEKVDNMVNSGKWEGSSGDGNKETSELYPAPRRPRRGHHRLETPADQTPRGETGEVSLETPSHRPQPLPPAGLAGHHAYKRVSECELISWKRPREPERIPSGPTFLPSANPTARWPRLPVLCAVLTRSPDPNLLNRDRPATAVLGPSVPPGHEDIVQSRATWKNVTRRM
uniref:Uncharacterized protein n=1 Tax=Molossus molossus TaxID=27622 RepID=A0A7J8FSU4_MOLMO|nr:hypothetical protein HJG59_008442 [Molossus molossus]